MPNSIQVISSHFSCITVHNSVKLGTTKFICTRKSKIKSMGKPSQARIRNFVSGVNLERGMY